VVPFFPAEWKKQSNDVFNQILMGQNPSVILDAATYDEAAHAAVHRKVLD